jgi:hypothetical protein
VLGIFQILLISSVLEGVKLGIVFLLRKKIFWPIAILPVFLFDFIPRILVSYENSSSMQTNAVLAMALGLWYSLAASGYSLFSALLYLFAKKPFFAYVAGIIGGVVVNITNNSAWWCSGKTFATLWGTWIPTLLGGLVLIAYLVLEKLILKHSKINS